MNASDHAAEAASKAALPLSDVDAEALYEWVENAKAVLAVVEADVRDAKRRLTAVKKPKKSKPADEDNVDEGSSSVEDGED